MCLEFNFTYATQISSGSVKNTWRHVRDDVIIKNFIENDRVYRKNKI